jgi:hypothetical protein
MGLSVESFGSGAIGTAATASFLESSVLFSGVRSAVSRDLAATSDSSSLDASADAVIPVIGLSDNSVGAGGLSSISSEATALGTLGPGGLVLLVERRFFDLWLIALPPSNCTSKAGVCATGLNQFK